MIGESICLGRDGIHFDLFIKVGRLIGTLSPANCRVPSALQISPKRVPSRTHAARHHISFQRRGPPESPAVFIFLFKHV